MRIDFKKTVILLLTASLLPACQMLQPSGLSAAKEAGSPVYVRTLDFKNWSSSGQMIAFAYSNLDMFKTIEKVELNMSATFEQPTLDEQPDLLNTATFEVEQQVEARGLSKTIYRTRQWFAAEPECINVESITVYYEKDLQLTFEGEKLAAAFKDQKTEYCF